MSDPSTPGSETRTPTPERANLFGAANISAILRQRGWHGENPSEAQLAWCERAAALLGPHALDLSVLEGLLGLVFEYDAHAILRVTDAHAILSRNAARDVIRQV